ncbi:MAG: hypothetical protein JWO78_1731 [Micavibrio sp.]|nr:hypothetical protein [Micavibrio sp.]
MGCCQHDPAKAETPKTEGGCCGGSAMKKESCCKGSKIAGFFKMLLGKKCCGSADCKT